MIMMGLDREIEKCKAELERANSCVILICDNGEMVIMNLISGESRSVQIPVNEKNALMTAMRKAFK